MKDERTMLSQHNIYQTEFRTLLYITEDIIILYILAEMNEDANIGRYHRNGTLKKSSLFTE